MRPFLSLAETSRRLDLDPARVLELVREQRLPAFQEDGEWCFKPEHVELFAREGRVRAQRGAHPAAGRPPEPEAGS
ncbi:helix-turn-helix domain-containing protein [Limnochorda pilosa]|uniref:Helix-turn-helix domain-containing protein n=1 Tax=Limnochorda pilosa TaxID=1555112 RepID=A0A0K2SG25_LIMPI|nr:helix-turn-helix domain-containing protein [Limnochorda pilosa]BAS26045.1 hypothetical protein LIP_0188 [Limnochorda pilosa]